jgi:hypothetical protein
MCFPPCITRLQQRIEEYEGKSTLSHSLARNRPRKQVLDNFSNSCGGRRIRACHAFWAHACTQQRTSDASPTLRPLTTTVVTCSRRVQFECNILGPDYLVWNFIADRTYVLDTGLHAAVQPTGRHLPPTHAGKPSGCRLRRKLDNVSVGNISRTNSHRPPTAVSRVSGSASVGPTRHRSRGRRCDKEPRAPATDRYDAGRPCACRRSLPRREGCCVPLKPSPHQTVIYCFCTASVLSCERRSCGRSSV